MNQLLLVTLVHNRKNLVSQALQSAVNQSLDKKYWKHIVVDNASTDGASKISQAFANKYNHIHFKQMDKNLGQQRAYNYVLYEWLPENYAEATVIVILDSDDLLYPNALQEVKNIYDAHPLIGGTYSGFNIINASGKVKVKNHPKAKFVSNQFTTEGQKILRKIFLKQNPCGHLRTYSVSALLNINGFNTERQYATDYSIFGHLMLNKYQVVKIDKVLYAFRQHGAQIEGSKSKQQTKDWLDMQKKFNKLFREKGLI